jgi:hypothetical protein
MTDILDLSANIARASFVVWLGTLIGGVALPKKPFSLFTWIVGVHEKDAL